MPEVREIVASSILTPQKVGSLSPYYDYSLNPYAGCAFSCSYCYVPKFPNARHEFMDWGKWVDVKMNAPELVRRDRTKIFGSKIFFSSATDPYQYLELKYRLTRRCLEELLHYKPAHITMHTRSHLILQDLELLKAFGPTLSVGVSFTTDIESVRREFEPKAPSVQRRLDLIRSLHQAGVDVYISMSPLLPCNPERFAEMIAPYVDKVWVDTMRWTDINTKPELIEKYAAHFETEAHEMLIREMKRLFRVARSKYREAARSKSKESGMSSYDRAPYSVASKRVDKGPAATQLMLPL